MRKAFLITRPNHDLVTNYLFHWSAPVINEAASRNFQILDLRERKANKKDFDSYVEKNKPDLIFFNGHGSENVICGYDDEILVEVDKNENTLLPSRQTFRPYVRSGRCGGVCRLREGLFLRLFPVEHHPTVGRWCGQTIP